MLRRITDICTRFLGWSFRLRRVHIVGIGKLVKVNLGSGLAVATDWTNVDGSLNALFASCPRWIHRMTYRVSGASGYYTFQQYHSLLSQNRFVFHDLSYGAPFADNAVDYVFSSHFLEHLSRRDGCRLIGEIYRILKPGGRVRLSVPDLDYALSLYNRGEKELMLQNYFFVDHDGSHHSRHKYMYEYDGLKNILAENGFVDIEKWVFQKGKLPDIELLDNRPEDSLFVEAVKPDTVGKM
ncbi:MAG: methyltransferase domain-containing protein [Pseudomonadota bacterium]